MKTQTKIDTEIDGNKLLITIKQYGPEVIWTVGTLSDVLGWMESRVNRAIAWLKSAEYLTGYSVTTEGELYLEGARHKPQIEVDAHAWKTEARTGLRTYGKRTDGDWQRSKIQRAAIPNAEPLTYEDATPEHIYSEAELKKRREQLAADLLGVPLNEFRKLSKEGRVKECKGLDGVRHLGVFHRDRKYFRPLCRECEKRKKQ